MLKDIFRGKPQTSFGILISIGDTSRKEKRRYAICSAALFHYRYFVQICVPQNLRYISVFGSSFLKKRTTYRPIKKFLYPLYRSP